MFAAPLWLGGSVGCSALASATSYNKHTDASANGELGQLFASHGDAALGNAPVPTPQTKYALTIERHDAYDQKCNSAGFSPKSVSVTPRSGGKVGIPFPDESCSAVPAQPELDFVDASCDGGACVVTNEAGSDATHLVLTVTVPKAGDAHLAVHVRRRDTGADIIDSFVIRARTVDAIAVYNGDRSSPISRAIFEDATLNWCMALTGGGLTVEAPEAQPFGVTVDGTGLALSAPFVGHQSCLGLQASAGGKATVHLTGGGISRDVVVHIAERSSATKLDLYLLNPSYHPEQKNDVEVDPVGEPFTVHTVRPTRTSEVSFSLVSVVTLADGTTALGGAHALRADFAAGDPSVHAEGSFGTDSEFGDDAYVSLSFLAPVKTTASGTLTSQLGPAKLLFAMTVQAE